jgi:23S rRNA pseudouridine1911/1915/1917 synthase
MRTPGRYRSGTQLCRNAIISSIGALRPKTRPAETRPQANLLICRSNNMIPFLHERWPVVHEDNHLLVLYKPAGLLVQGDETGAANLLDLAKAWLKQRHHKPGRVFLGLVQRLDRPVAGVMMFARTSKAAARLSAQLRRRQTRKVYLAVVEGRLPSERGELTNHLERQDRLSRIVPQPTSSSREARLSYRVLEAADDRRLVEIELETGRKHQIRLQMAHLGCPIVGDVRYGSQAPLASGQIALLAWKITLEHPTRSEALSFSCPLPIGWLWPAADIPINAPLWNWEDYKIPAGSF